MKRLVSKGRTIFLYGFSIPMPEEAIHGNISTHQCSFRKTFGTTHALFAALRVGDMVLQSGTTAIDRQGDVHGEGDMTKHVEAIMALAEWSIGKARGKLADIE